MRFRTTGGRARTEISTTRGLPSASFSASEVNNRLI
jgi:hypothetical protein